ncbi:MAG: hypothetical protein ACK4UU_02850 [Fimbriimonadales bacterium]
MTGYPTHGAAMAASSRPGTILTGLTQIRYRHEERLLAQHADPEKYYRETLLPLKLQSDVEYVRRRSLRLDALLLARTAVALFERDRSTIATDRS